MSPDEALRLCRMAKSVSPAQAVDEYTPQAWSLILAGVRLADAEQALAELGGEQEWIHVSHIVQRVKRIRRNRVLDFGTLPDPPRHIDPDNVAQHGRWLSETTKAIADGTYEAPAPEAIDGPTRDVRELGQAQSINTALAAKPLRAEHAKAVREKQAAEVAAKEERREKQQRLENMRAAERAARETKTDPSEGACRCLNGKPRSTCPTSSTTTT